MVCPVLWDCCPVSMSCLSVTLVYCGQTIGWIKTPLGMEVGLGPGDIVLMGTQSPPQKGAQHSHFSARVYCSQTVANLSNCRARVKCMMLLLTKQHICTALHAHVQSEYWCWRH